VLQCKLGCSPAAATTSSLQVLQRVWGITFHGGDETCDGFAAGGNNIVLLDVTPLSMGIETTGKQ
jgi:hypothetical protein